MNNLEIPLPEFEFLQKLAEDGAFYLLIGGYALKHFHCGRPTEDVDILMRNSPENAKCIYRVVVTGLGYQPRFNFQDLTRSKKQLRVPYNKIDILTSIDGLDFDEAYERRESAVQYGIVIPVISREDLIYVKQLAAADEGRRLRELDDIDCLKRVSEE
jgi:hypothetical protein